MGDYRYLHGDGDGVMEEHRLVSELFLEDKLQHVPFLQLDERADGLIDTRTDARVSIEDANDPDKYPACALFSETIDPDSLLFATGLSK